MTQLAQVKTQQRAIIPVNGHQIAALIFNREHAKDTVPVIFIHGIGSSIDFWTAGQPDALQDHYWASLSLPGHYPAAIPSDYTAADITAEGLAAVVAEAIRKLTDGKPALLVGHSTGGFMALNVAAHAPELVRGVLSVAGFAHGYWTGAFHIAQVVSRMGTWPGRWIMAYTNWLMRTPHGYENYMHNLVVDFPAMQAAPMYKETFDVLYANAKSGDGEALRYWFQRMPDIDITPQLKKINVPVMHVHGEKDPIVPPSQGPHIIEHIDQGELITVPGCGHMVPWERNADYQAALTRALANVVE